MAVTAKDALWDQLKADTAFQNEMNKVLSAAYKQAEAAAKAEMAEFQAKQSAHYKATGSFHVPGLKGPNPVSSAQSFVFRTKMAAVNDAIYKQMAGVLPAQIEQAMKQADAMTMSIAQEMLQGIAVPPWMVESWLVQAENAIEAAAVRMSGASAKALSSQVWKTQALSQKLIDHQIAVSLASGESAKQMAKRVLDLINPKVPGGVSYAAMRLGRSEINNAYHTRSAQRYSEMWWVNGVKWHLSSSHPKPDECDEYAHDTHFKGGEPGVFKSNEVPSKPHPQCFCYISPVSISDDEFLDQLLKKNGLNVSEAQKEAAQAKKTAISRNRKAAQAKKINVDQAKKGLKPYNPKPGPNARRFNSSTFADTRNFNAAAELKANVAKNLEKALRDIPDSVLLRHMPGFEDHWMMDILKRGNAAEILETRQMRISQMIHNWAVTSGDHDAISVSFQVAARDLFGLNTAVFSPNMEASAIEILDKMGWRTVFNRFLEEQYKATQAWFKSQGITEVSAYRGMSTKGLSRVKAGDEVDIQWRPLSSWSGLESTGAGFAQGPSGMVFRAGIPVEDILSCPATGFGCFNEQEIVVLAQPGKVGVHFGARRLGGWVFGKG